MSNILGLSIGFTTNLCRARYLELADTDGWTALVRLIGAWNRQVQGTVKDAYVMVLSRGERLLLGRLGRKSP